MNTASVRAIAARVAHDALSSLRIALGEPSLPAWDTAGAWMRRDTYALVNTIMANGACSSAEAEHTRWYNDRVEAGWTHGPIRDDSAKVNPLLLPWEKLSPEARQIATAKTELQIEVICALIDAFEVP